MSTVDMPLTPEQRAALSARDRSVSLAAGAGCGKTFVLTERFIAEVDPTAADAKGDLQELVAITFTDAAAREMRERIRSRCLERLRQAKTADEAAAWQRLMRSIDAARISTIHSFCTALLRTHAVEAGLDPQFEVLDAAAADLLRLDVVDQRLRELLIAGDADALDAAAARGLERLRTDMTRLCQPRESAAIARWRDATTGDLVQTWSEFFEQHVLPAAIREMSMTPAFVELEKLADQRLATSPKLRSHLVELRSALDDWRVLSGAEASAAAETLNRLARVQGVCGAKDWAEAEHYGAFKNACTAVRELCAKLTKKTFDPEQALEAARLGLALLRLVDGASAALDEAKARRNQLEFDDLLVRAHRLLTDPASVAIRQQIARTTRLLMVDEFQDTNDLQLAIIQAFCGEEWRQRGLFAVGDFKQSIYRFNGAEPSVSTELRESLPTESRLSLTTNFRSQPAVLDFVNAVFAGAFADYEPLVPARPQLTATPAVEFLWAPADVEEQDEGTPDEQAADTAGRARRPQKRRAGAAADVRRREARWIARQLRQLLESQEPIVVEEIDGTATPRPLRPGDVAILLRSLADVQAYEEALREQGLECYLAGGHAFYSQQEIFDVLNLLRAVASGVDEIALAGALRSPMFSLTDETLFWMVEEYKSLNAALATGSLRGPLPAGEAAKLRRAASTIRRLRDEKDRLLVAELLALALELTGYDATVLCEFLGPRKAANIEKLVEQARARDQSSPGDLAGFITQLSEFVVRAPKEPLAATQAEGDVIRIMTIHYAKGLEFPLVVLPDLDRQRRGPGSDPVIDATLGPLVPLEDAKGRVGLDLYRWVEDQEDLEERKRLFYVACTRAADYLILSSSIADPAEPRQDWLRLVNDRISLIDGSLRAPLPTGWQPPSVRVIAEEPKVGRQEGGAGRGVDLGRLVAKTLKLAEAGHGVLPREAAEIPVHSQARRRFSYSRISGELLSAESLADDSWAGDQVSEGWASSAFAASSMGRDVGVLVHAVLQRIDFRLPTSGREWCEYLAPQVVEGDSDVAARAAAPMIERFLKSPRAASLARAAVLRREVEFVLPWPPDSPAADQRDGRYLHGFLDCLYQDSEGAWRLLDYKTNHTVAASVRKMAELYELQLLAYRLACEQALGQSLAECALVMLDFGEEIPFEWDDAAVRNGVKQLSAAMDGIGSQECLHALVTQ